jgi:hypothetical protein
MTTSQLIEMQLRALRLLTDEMRITFGAHWIFLGPMHNDEVVAQ